MAKDIDLLAKNAKTYNEPGSQVFKVRSCDDSGSHYDSINNFDVSEFPKCNICSPFRMQIL